MDEKVSPWWHALWALQLQVSQSVPEAQVGSLAALAWLNNMGMG